MLSRLDWMTVQPQIILEVGCGPATCAAALKTRYPQALVLAMDTSWPMLQFANATHPALSICAADVALLPLRDHSVDLIFAHFLLPWHDDSAALFAEWARVLRPNGLLMVTALGPDTLREWRDVLHDSDLPLCVDMHDVGDVLLAKGFSDPVLEVNYYTMAYREHKQFSAELQASGFWFPSFTTTLPMSNTKLEATFEVIFAHAFAPEACDEVGASRDGVVRIPLTQLRRSR